MRPLHYFMLGSCSHGALLAHILATRKDDFVAERHVHAVLSAYLKKLDEDEAKAQAAALKAAKTEEAAKLAALAAA